MLSGKNCELISGNSAVGFLIEAAVRHCLAASRPRDRTFSTRVSVTLRDDSRVRNAFGQFERGSEKRTQLTVSEDNVGEFMAAVANFLLSQSGKFAQPVLDCRIALQFDDRLSTVDLLAATLTPDCDSLPRFLRLASESIHRRAPKPVEPLNSHILLNDLLAKNYCLTAVSLLSNRASRLSASMAALRANEWLKFVIGSMRAEVGRKEVSRSQPLKRA